MYDESSSPLARMGRDVREVATRATLWGRGVMYVSGCAASDIAVLLWGIGAISASRAAISVAAIFVLTVIYGGVADQVEELVKRE